MFISKATKGRAALFSMLWIVLMFSTVLLSPVAEYQRRKYFLVGTWFTPDDKQTLIMKYDRSFQMFDDRGNPTYEGTYELRGFSHLLLQSLAYTDEGGRHRKFGTSETMESLNSGLTGHKVYIPLYGNKVYCESEIAFGSPLASKDKKTYTMERR